MYRLTSLLASGSVLTWIYSIPLLGATSDACQDCGPIQWPDGTRFSLLWLVLSLFPSLQAFAPQGVVEYLQCTFRVFTGHTCIPIRMDFINNMNMIIRVISSTGTKGRNQARTALQDLHHHHL